jgi:hypothetical protein
MGTGGSFPGVKRKGREADHSPPASAEVKKMWIYKSTPLYVFTFTEILTYSHLAERTRKVCYTADLRKYPGQIKAQAK